MGVLGAGGKHSLMLQGWQLMMVCPPQGSLRGCQQLRSQQ
jgi:hypothetical protein